MMPQMDIRSSHIYREGNVLADILSNVALEREEFKWWERAIPEISKAVYEDRIGKIQFRFR